LDGEVSLVEIASGSRWHGSLLLVPRQAHTLGGYESRLTGR